jgi:hypothetical protein
VKRHRRIIRIIAVIMLLLILAVILAPFCNAARKSTVFNVCDIPLYTCPYRYIGEYQIYGYVPGDLYCCGKTDGIGAGGEKIIPGKHVAMYKDMPFGTEVKIIGLGEYTVADRGVGPGIIDVASETYADCYKITGKYAVYVKEG